LHPNAFGIIVDSKEGEIPERKQGMMKTVKPEKVELNPQDSITGMMIGKNSREKQQKRRVA